MIYPHEDNIKTKIKSNYGGIGSLIQGFYDSEYKPLRTALLALTLDKSHKSDFKTFATLVNNYYDRVVAFGKANNIDSHSKWESTFLEEMNSFLFKDLPELVTNKYGTYNKKIYTGIKIDENDKIVADSKDVDFCIGKELTIKIVGQKDVKIIKPVVAVEVKTYTDATMFGEIKSSSQALKSGTINCSTYVLMGTKNMADKHIQFARSNIGIDEMFVLRKDSSSPMNEKVFYDYWLEISDRVSQFDKPKPIKTPGKLLHL